jgi:hypothetical protein
MDTPLNTLNSGLNINPFTDSVLFWQSDEEESHVPSMETQFLIDDIQFDGHIKDDAVENSFFEDTGIDLVPRNMYGAIICDGDPHGISIMLCYIYGSIVFFV